jgi:hypothetical protein
VQTTAGLLTDVFAASYQIYDITTDGNEQAPVQVFPATLGAKQTINVAGAEHLGVGRYAAAWAPAGGATLGKYLVRYFYQLTSTSPERSFDQEFELVAAAYKGPNYCAIYELRAEGLSSSDMSDLNCQRAIVAASRLVERVTGRRFSPLYKTVQMDGTGRPALLLNEAICAIEQVAPAGGEAIDPIGFRVFNRHLSQGLTMPDDRNNPKIEFLSGTTWAGDEFLDFTTSWFARGIQNVTLTGVFGFTDPDGSFAGATPDLIRRATMLLVFRNRARLSDTASRDDALKRPRLKRERTADQEYELFEPFLRGAFSGDPEIDQILASYVRPPILEAA